MVKRHHSFAIGSKLCRCMTERSRARFAPCTDVMPQRYRQMRDRSSRTECLSRVHDRLLGQPRSGLRSSHEERRRAEGYVAEPEQVTFVDLRLGLKRGERIGSGACEQAAWGLVAVRLLSGFRVVTGTSGDEARDEGAEQSFAPAARVVHELEEAEIERQLVLRDAPVRSEPGAQQGPELSMVLTCTSQKPSPSSSRAYSPRPWQTVLC